MLTRTTIVFGTLLISNTGLVDAQRAPHPVGSPAAVADSFLTRIARKDFLGATDLTDSASLAAFHREQISLLWLTDSLQKVPPRPRTDVPPAVAEYYEIQQRKFEATYGSHVEREFGVKTLAEVERMTPRELLARLLSNQHPETQLAYALRAQGRDSLAPEILTAFGGIRTPRVIGTVLASDSLAYALFQDDTGDAGAGPQVLPVRRTRDGWRLRASDAAFTMRGGSCSFGFAMMDSEEP